ncbi:MAG: cation diffusion facilitator family transporter [Bacteroidia bacterium]
MQHGHSHQHSPSAGNLNRAFTIGIILNAVFVIIEFATGLATNSLALLSDAGHNLSDVATLALSLFAFSIARRRATLKYTYGYQKGTILASLINAIILLIAVGSIGWEAVQRFLKPVETQGNIISIVAGIGIVINAVSALMFFRDKEKDINVKGAYLHLAMDAIVSVGVVIAGIIITYTGLTWIDPLISLVIMAVVIYSTWGLLTKSLQLSLDAVPSDIEIEKIRATAMNIKGIKRIRHIHVWAMSTTKNAMTADLLIEPELNEEQISEMKQIFRHKLEHMNIHHVTLETTSRSV